MGCCYSRSEREEMVSRCKARKRYMKHLVKARRAFSAAHSTYLRSLRCTGAALIQFSNIDTHHHLSPSSPSLSPPPPPPLPLPPPSPPPPMSPCSDTWMSVTASPAHLPPPPPPPPPSSWDFWDPFASSTKSANEEEWEAATTTTVSDVALVAPPRPPPPLSVTSGPSSKESSEAEQSAVVVKNGRDLAEIIKEVDEYFLKAAESGTHVSLLLEAKSSSFSTQRMTSKVCNIWPWGSDPKSSSFGRFGEEVIGGVNRSHCSTVERLYAWEKKLFLEVKNAESIKIEHEKRVSLLRKQEAKGVDYMKIEKTKKETERLESMLMVASHAMETTSAEIINLRETELYPQLLELVKGLMSMWRSMYECHQVQTHIVDQLKFSNNTTLPGAEPTSETHRQSTLQLELEVHQWHSAFCNLIKTHRDYIRSLTGWLRLSLFQFNANNPLAATKQSPAIYSLCEEWQLALDRIPDKVASEGINSLLTVIHAIVIQQTEEKKQKKRSEAAFKELEKNVASLRSLESKYGPYSENLGSHQSSSPVTEKRAKVVTLKEKADNEKVKHERCVGVTRAMTLNNLRTGFPNVFEAMTGFSSVCMQAFESVYNKPKMFSGEDDEIKKSQN